MAEVPNFKGDDFFSMGTISAANSGRDGSGTLVEVAAGQDGPDARPIRVDSVECRAVGVTTAGMIRIFLTMNSGTNKRLIAEVKVAPITPTASVKTWWNKKYLESIPLLSPAHRLYCSTEKAETFSIKVQGSVM